MEHTRDKQWAKVGARHSRAVARFLTAAKELSAAQWRAPIGDDKWTPAQITQHVTQSYDVLTRQLRTGTGLRVQTGWLLRQVLRVVVLRPIMWTRRLPPGAKAARELLPGETDLGQEEALARLGAAVAGFEHELQARRDEAGLQLTHHIFGSVEAVKGLDFVAVHTEHHARQLSRQLRRGVGPATPPN